MTDETYLDAYGDGLQVDCSHGPGHAYLTASTDVELSREQVAEVVQQLQDWLGADQPQAEPPGCCTGEDSSTCCPVQVPTITAEAEAAVYGDRQDDYGHPREDFTRTAVIWQGLLLHKLADGESVGADDVARCMIGVKLARDVHAAKRDNRVDMAGYALTLDRLETGR